MRKVRTMQHAAVFFVGICLVFAGCSDQATRESVSPQAGSEMVEKKINASEAEWQEALGNNAEKDFKPFPIYTNKGSRDNHYIPSGFMGDASCLKFNDAMREGCHDGSTCIEIIYDVECSRMSQSWAGIYWQNPANNWGNRKGGYNLVGASKLTFWAKGKKGGERIEEFKIGGISGDYPDTDSAFIGPVILSDEWREYSIDLRGKDMSYIIGGFSWSTNVDVNPEGCTFYLDDIKYQ